jgi:YYY domain-containing protein
MLESLRWWLAMEALALIGLPLCLSLFRSLPDRGFAFNKAIALIAVCYAFWILNTAHVLPNSLAGVAGAMAIVAAISAAVLWRSRRGLWSWLREAAWYAITVELLTLAVFAAVAWFRAQNGQINLGEKRMEFMFINAVHQADHFPPQDAWLAGHDVSYYYFGYLMTSAVSRVAAVPTEIAFNLAFAMFVAVAASTAFGLTFNLVRLAHSSPGGSSADSSAGNPQHVAISLRLPSVRPALAWAAAGGLVLLLLGNLVAPLLFLSSWGVGSDGFYEALDIQGLAPDAARRWWYPSDPYVFGIGTHLFESETFVQGFVESPMISIAGGDLHPHAIDLGFLLAGLAAVLTLMKSRLVLEPSTFARLGGFGLITGATGFVNTWDLPVLLALAAAAILVRAARDDGLLRGIAAALILSGFAVLPYAPFYLALNGSGRGLYPVIENDRLVRSGSAPLDFILHWAVLLGIVVPFVIVHLRERWEKLRPGHLLIAAALPIAVLLAWAALVLSQEVAGAHHAQNADGLLGQIAARGDAWISAVLAGALLVASTAALVAHLRHCDATATTFALLLVSVGAGLILGVEFFYVDDFFTARTVTVFKLTYAAWALLAVAAGFALFDLARRLRGSRDWTARASAALAILALAAGLVLPLGAIPNRIRPDAPAGHLTREVNTLDGLRSYSQPERAAIEWLRDRAHGQSYVLAEAVMSADGRTDYNAAGRLSMASGIPAVIAWPLHEEQWRGGPGLLGDRVHDVDRLYRTTSAEEASAILRDYDVDFVAVGIVERTTYTDASLAKFESFPVAFRAADVVIYDVSSAK